MQKQSIQLIRRPESQGQFSHSKTTFYNHIKLGIIPPPINLGGRSVAWVKHEIDAVINARIAGQTDNEIKTLVTQLVAQRKQYKELCA
jgi:prophage regulatory protein